MSHPKHAAADHPIQDPARRRWSPYAFSERSVDAALLRSLFEAARWAASAANEQPCRWVVATREEPSAHADLLSCLVEGNRVWACRAPVLALGIVCTRFERSGKPNAFAAHDLGLATATLALEATARGLAVHTMGGILPERAREIYRVPEAHQPLTALAIGYAGDPASLPEALRGRDFAPRTRRGLAESVFGGEWGRSAGFLDGD